LDKAWVGDVGWNRGLRPLLTRLRFQVLSNLCVMIVAVLLPSSLGFAFAAVTERGALPPRVIITFLFCFLASTAALWVLRLILKYPGLSRGPYVLPILSLAFGAVILTFFLFRVEYSRYVFVASFLATFIWLQGLFIWQDATQNSVVALAPGCDAKQLAALPHTELVVLTSPDLLPRAVTSVVADLHAKMEPEWERFIARCSLAGLPVYDMKTVLENATGKTEISSVAETTFGSVLPSNAYNSLKRFMEFLLALTVLPLVLLIVLVAAIAIKLNSPGPILFSQQRMGYRAKPFYIYKLRTMQADASDGSAFTVRHDPRITRVGTFLRKYRIDELPQVINILRGEMSWIGPRPEAMELANLYASQIPFYIYRHTVRPGITGWAQVNQGNVAMIDAATEKLRYDFFYIKHLSPALDVLIALRTIKTVLTGFGAN
jgi:lipopolysaccharide/colanic/teichoic acid biosynthesis glycosyltransferase